MSYDGPFPIIVKDGGTGAATLTGVLTGNGTSAMTATAITQYNVLTAGASNVPNSVAPSATSGVPLISQGASSQPVFGTTVVAGGGTGLVSATAYAVLCGGTTATGAFQSIAGVGTSGQVLTSNGAGALPTFQASGTSSVTITGDSGGGLTGSSFTFTGGTTGLSFGGSGTTETLSGTLIVANGGTGRATLTNHGVLVGATTSAITQLAAGSAGQVLQSGGASADPAYSTATYPTVATTTGTILRADGTNWVKTTATYPNTTTSQQILYSTATSVIGELTTANSAIAATNSSGTLAMRAFSVVIQFFTATGTYTPTSGMIYCDIQCVGGGGAGGGAATTNGAQTSSGGGGGGGEYTRATFSAATIGASKSVTIGAGGTGASGTTGGTGGTTSVGSTLISAIGGTGGATGAASATSVTSAGGAGGTGGTGGTVDIPGQTGLYGYAAFGSWSTGGNGGSSVFGGGAAGNIAFVGTTSTGTAATVYGSGGAGCGSGISQSAVTGGAGFKGIVIVTEYIIA